MNNNPGIYIGTSGWHYKHWIGTFYPEGTKDSQQMSYYVNFFKTVELNNSFYMLPTEKTFENWKNSAPQDFIFAIKASRYITHMKKLKDTSADLITFLQHAGKLEHKLGPVLFQLPPGWKINIPRLIDFLKILPQGYRYTFEFRNHSWYDDMVYQLLQHYNCAFCIYELEGHLSPKLVTADFVYIRLHGPAGKYAGSYSDHVLAEWANECQKWVKLGKDVFIYFDNDQAGYAAFNAKKLNEILNQG